MDFGTGVIMFLIRRIQSFASAFLRAVKKNGLCKSVIFFSNIRGKLCNEYYMSMKLVFGFDIMNKAQGYEQAMY